MHLDGKRILVTGGTGSLGRAIVRRLLTGELGRPSRITVFSRDEAKQHTMRLHYMHSRTATDEVIFSRSPDVLGFRIGDMRDPSSVAQAVCHADVIIHAAALKQVPNCEYFPHEAVLTNVLGAQNLVEAIRMHKADVEAVVGISTDKACKPINVMGMTKALMERILVQANMEYSRTRFSLVRYGNVISSRGSVIPLFIEQASRGGPLTVTTAEMTRFLISMDRAVDTVFAALDGSEGGGVWVPRIPSARVVDLAKAVVGERKIPITFTGIRPGEKVHEVMVSEEECHRTSLRNGHFVIHPMLPELAPGKTTSGALASEYTSADVTLDVEGISNLIAPWIARMSHGQEKYGE